MDLFYKLRYDFINRFNYEVKKKIGLNFNYFLYILKDKYRLKIVINEIF